jgi:hypothetical protein
VLLTDTIGQFGWFLEDLNGEIWGRSSNQLWFHSLETP